jgi:hypothetical protein
VPAGADHREIQNKIGTEADPASDTPMFSLKPDT